MGDPGQPPKELSTVSVPDGMREPFLRAQEYVARFFEDRVFDPAHSNISISGERYVLVRAASMSVEFFDLVMSLYADRGTQEARLVASNLLFDIAHSIGRGDARAFHERMKVTDPIEKLSAGPIHFSFTGWAFVKILPESSPTPDENFYLIYEHPFSFESDSWIRRERKSEYPVCIMNAGYSSGWCEESFGLPLVAAEVECLARGDAQCRFVMSPPSRIEGHLARYLSAPERASKRSWPSRPVPVSIPEFFQRKRMEEELKASRARLEHRVQERTAQLAGANAALEAEIAERIRAEQDRSILQTHMQNSRKLDSLGALAGGIAHDFNNLLVGILGNTEIALDDLPKDSALSAPLERIKKAAERAAVLTRQMLAYAGKGRVEMESVNLSQLLTEWRETIVKTAGDKARLQFDLATELPSVDADVAQIRQAILNLVENAAEAINDGGDIQISTGLLDATEQYLAESSRHGTLTPGRYLYVQVSDTGEGIDDATREKIFDPFFSTRLAGRGLGLAVALGIVRSHRGAIHVTSLPGRGSAFRILLPCPEVQAAKPAAFARSNVTGSILVIDDEDTVLEVAQAMLERAGYRVVTASGGRQAIEILRAARNLRAEPVLLALVDMTMPDLNGGETLAEIERIFPGLPVILTSGYNEEDARRRYNVASQPRFLQKPFSSANLIAKIKEVLG